MDYLSVFPSFSLIFSDCFLLTVANLTCSNSSPPTIPIPIFFKFTAKLILLWASSHWKINPQTLLLYLNCYLWGGILRSLELCDKSGDAAPTGYRKGNAGSVRQKSPLKVTEWANGRQGLGHRFPHDHFTCPQGHHTTVIAGPGAFWTAYCFPFIKDANLADPINFITQDKGTLLVAATCSCGEGLADHLA